MLRDLRGGGLLGTLVGRWEAPAGRTISACSWLQGPSRPRAGAWGASRSAPTRGQGGGEERSGVPKENPAPSGVLEKLSPKDTQAWMCGSREGSSETRSGCQGRGKIPRDHAGGRFLKEATPGGRPWEGPPGERADSTTRPQGRQEAAGPRGLQTEAGVTCGRQRRGEAGPQSPGCQRSGSSGPSSKRRGATLAILAGHPS